MPIVITQDANSVPVISSLSNYNPLVGVEVIAYGDRFSFVDFIILNNIDTRTAYTVLPDFTYGGMIQFKLLNNIAPGRYTLHAAIAGTGPYQISNKVNIEIFPAMEQV